MAVGKRGFTFVELLLAATILSVLFVGLGAHVRGGVIVWRRTTSGLEALQRRRVALDRLGDDLANAVLFNDGSVDAPLPARSFGESELRFVSVDRGYSVRAPALRVITYRCGDEDGVAGLWRTSLTLAQARMNEEVKPQRMLEGCTALRLRYGYAGAEGIEWQDAWRFPDEQPQVIEAQFEFAGRPTLRQVLIIPTGALKPVEAP